ncbi:hypothetical protein BDV35DRAFT_347534, partial [Aspergillus flavus]
MPRERGIRQDDKFNSLARIPTILLVIVSVSFALVSWCGCRDWTERRTLYFPYRGSLTVNSTNLLPGCTPLLY